jgi:putative transposase
MPARLARARAGGLAPGVIHHVMIRGIERGSLFRDDKDRDDMIDRLVDLLPATKTACYAWVFSPPIRGSRALPTLMRRLLTGYAIRFNRRHRRHGQLFLSEA